MEPLLIANDLDSDENPGLVVDAADNLAEAPLSEDVNNFVPVGQVVPRHDGVVATLIVVAKVGRLRVHITHYLGGVLSSAEVNVVVVDDLTALIDVQHGDANRILRTDAFLGGGPLPECIQCPGCELCLLASGSQPLHLLLGEHVVFI